MGLVYGPVLQGITAIHQGSHQVLAQLRLPRAVEDTWGDYVLHPSLMDSALQAAVALVEGGSELINQPPLPFALESLRMVSTCSREMFAWVRYAPGSQASDKVVKLDIDLCDEGGNVCVQIRGFSSRVLSQEIIAPTAQGQEIGSLLAVPVWQAKGIEGLAGKSQIAYREHHVILCEQSQVDVEKLGSLLPHSQCLLLEAGEEKNIAERDSEYALACFERIQAILRGKRQGKVLVQIVVAGHEEQVLLAGLLWLLKTAALENPQLVGQLILVSAALSTEELGRRLQGEETGDADALIRYEPGARQVLGWQEVRVEERKSPIAFQDRGVYLITGGLGGLGVLFAKANLEQTGQGRVVLTGRSALSAEKQALLDGLSAQASRVSYRQLDLGDLDQVKQLIAGIQEEYGQLNGILHCAGMIADNFILKKASAEFSQVLAPKVAGTYHLDQASQEVELDFFVLFSSLAGAMGNVGQADYATANGFMDQFAAYRNRLVAARQRQGRTRSINWGVWQAGGVGIDAATQELLQQATGLQAMQTATGLQALYRSLALPYDQILVVEGELAQLRRALLAGRPIPPLSSSLLTVGEQPVAAETDGAEIDPDNLVEKTQDYLRRQCSELLKLPSHTIDPQAALEKYGIDSILAMKLTNQLERTVGSLSKTLFFEYQSIGELARYFIHSHGARLTTLLPTTGNGHRQIQGVDRGEETEQAPARLDRGRRFSRQRSTTGPGNASEALAIIR